MAEGKESGIDLDVGFGPSRGFLEDMEDVGMLDQVIGEQPAASEAEPPTQGTRRILSILDQGVTESIKNRSIDF